MKNLTSILRFCIGRRCVLYVWITVFSNDVKNWASILSSCIGHKCGSCNDDTKALLLCELHFSLILESRPLYHQLTIKHPSNILCNDVKNLTSILMFRIGRECVLSNDDMKALFLCELHFSLIFTNRLLNHQRTNKQLTDIYYTDAKNLTSVMSFCIGPKCAF